MQSEKKDGATTVLPFGKHKGKPITEVMLADPQWVQWVTAQPWFREKFAVLFSIVVNGGRADEGATPEHNRLQAMFLDRELCRSAYWHLAGADGRLTTNPLDQVYFEHHGWDVVIGHVYIELKPTVGDDYPVILRTMKHRLCGGRSYDCRALVVGQFEATGATFDQVKEMFRRSGIVVCRLSEIPAGETPGEQIP